MKRKSLSLSMLAMIIALALIMLISVIFVADIPMVANAGVAEVNVDYDMYTDSDTLLNSDITIREYPDMLYNSTTSLKASELTVTDDDSIVKIIPKSLFANVGEYMFI